MDIKQILDNTKTFLLDTRKIQTVLTQRSSFKQIQENNVKKTKTRFVSFEAGRLFIWSKCLNIKTNFVLGQTRTLKACWIQKEHNKYYRYVCLLFEREPFLFGGIMNSCIDSESAVYFAFFLIYLRLFDKTFVLKAWICAQC